MILFILYIAQNDSSVSMSLGSVGLSRHVLGLRGISLLLRVVSHHTLSNGITWNVNNDDGEAPRLFDEDRSLNGVLGLKLGVQVLKEKKNSCKLCLKIYVI